VSEIGRIGVAGGKRGTFWKQAVTIRIPPGDDIKGPVAAMMNAFKESLNVYNPTFRPGGLHVGLYAIDRLARAKQKRSTYVALTLKIKLCGPRSNILSGQTTER
jgi:hypothetical protein